jgi:uncharacterized damage-inducible protein DinB
MDKENVLLLLEYSYWVTGKILDVANHVSRAQLLESVTPNPGHGSLRGILVHTLDVEIGWRQVLQQLPLTPDLVEQDFPDIASIRTRWAVERGNWVTYCRNLADLALNAPYSYQLDNGPVRTRLVWQTIVHVIDHDIQHQSEAAFLLTGYGHSPGDLDFDHYLNIQSGAST